MASLEKMHILGVRSFSPDKRQEVKFFHPLTLILGPNGTGKTTIIECLRYITTGELPPSSDRGKAFVHDPKLAKDNEVKGQIMLKFKDIKQNTVVITRSMSLSQKYKTQEFKSLEGTIKRTIDGQVVSLSSRCAELDREMVSCFGVSKAILNNVIFCHQEESNWPLEDGKSLKIKFDQIFAATRYIKALDVYSKEKKALETNTKVMDVELMHYGEHCDSANKLRKDLERTETRLSASKDKVGNLQDKIAPIKEKLESIRKVERRINEVHDEKSRKDTELEIQLEAHQKLDKELSDKYAGSTAELEAEINNFGAQLAVKQRERDELQTNISEVERKMHPLMQRRDLALVELGKLKTEADQHKKNIQKRDVLVQRYSESYGLTAVSAFGVPLTDVQVNRTVEQLQAKIDAKLVDHNRIKEMYAAQERAIQVNLDLKNENRAKLEQTMAIKKIDISSNQKDIEAINASLAQTQEAAVRLNDIIEELQQKKRELETVSRQLDSASAQQEISDFQKQQSALELEIRQLDVELMKLMNQVKFRAELDGAQKDKASKEEMIRKLKSKHSDVLKHILGEVPVNNFRSSLQNFDSQISQEIRKLADEISKKNFEVASSDGNRRNKMEELKRKEAELRDSEDRVFEMIGSSDLEMQLNELQGSIKNLQEEKGSFTGNQVMYTKYVGKLQERDPCCPLCHRGFSEPLEVEELISEINNKLRLLPNDMVNKQKLLDDQQRKYSSILELRPLKTRIDALKDVEIPTLKNSIKTLNESIEKGRLHLKEIEEMHLFKQTDKAAVDSIQPDMGLLEQTLSDVKRIEWRIDDISKRVGGGTRTVDMVSQEKNNLNAKIDDIRQTLITKQARLNDHMRRTQSLQSDVNRLGEEHLNISKSIQQVARLEERKIDLARSIERFRKEIDDTQVQIVPIQNSILELEKNKDDLVMLKEQEMNDALRYVTDAKGHLKELEMPLQAIDRYVTSNRQEKLLNKDQELEIISTNIEQLETKKKDYTERQKKLNSDLASHKSRVRFLNDNRDLRVQATHIASLRKESAVLKERLGGFNINTLADEKKTLQNNAIVLERDINTATGVQDELVARIKSIQDDLNSDKYREAEKNYLLTMVKLTTSKMAATDIHKYSNALDKAIMQYHKEKMKEINKIIKDLWVKTYRGNDMDYIEIRSDVEETAGATTTSGRKKPYNYKVVMIKGDVVQGMRGRCSAGQKVLASLIIRLALAETFCMNCGILALDEPTTNLDRENIESLADELSNIVKMRLRQRNFQLVVITHDEEFVERLSRSEYVYHYHRVSKDEQGYSKVTKSSSKEIT